MNNKRAGTRLERTFCQQLAKDGFWVYFTNGNKQPADIIAVRDLNAYLIDVKNCKNDRFVFSRIEDNQRSSMQRFDECGNNKGLFALNTSKGIFMLRYDIVQYLEAKKKKSINIEDIKMYCILYEVWRGLI